ncbi:MAG TPA: 23S rRNA (uracil(1939)-C(5))-methyltransferase RlmD [Polyangia bacterium]|jgi:23S rRNA (uracil1939-C5)-methyltransferase|nr:23S rRNA (uracil(1939)-C(5))-methyltransferase RlmD [Polyangia bacterium]
MSERRRPGERLRLACVDVDEDGAGICQAANTDGGASVEAAVAASTVLVPGALPGERVIATVSHASPHQPRAWAALETIDVASAARRAPMCPAFGSCGGCRLQHWELAAQRAWKTQQVRAALATHPALATIPVAACMPSPHDLGYRNNAKLVYGRDAAGALVLGAYAPRSHEVVDLAGCRLVEPALDAAAVALRVALVAHDVIPYDERLLLGDLRYAVLRANHRGQVLATLVTARREWNAGAAVAADFRARCPAVAGVVHNVNPTRGNVIYGDEEVTLSGQPTLDEQIGPVALRLSSRAFFQANRAVAALAYAHIARAIADAAATVGAPVVDCLVDAYCGVGGIALGAAAQARTIVAIESNAAAITDATAAARAAGVSNVHFVVADAAAGLRAVDRADAVVVNPPRKGCAPAVIAEVLRLRPRLIAYLSCAPDTLARDLAALVAGDAGYRIESVTPYDMLPHTPHVEVLAMAKLI